jgi:light-regulated signal transduction histidine kinase (bacteriophytochrome)
MARPSLPDSYEKTDKFRRNELMDNDATAETVRNLKALAATLTELLDVQEKVVGEQSGLIRQNEVALKESNDRFFEFIKEAAMRLKNPLEVVEENLAVVVNDIEHGESEPGKNMEQIRKNIIELNKAIVDHFGEIPDASKKFLTE